VATTRWDQRRQATAPRRAVGDPRGAPGWIGFAEPILDATIGANGDAVGGDDRPQDVAREAFEPGAVGGVDRGIGVERKSIDDGRTPARRGRDGCARARVGRQGQLRGLRTCLVERVGFVVVAGIPFVATFQQALDSTDDPHRDGKDVVVGRWWERMKRHGAVGMLLPHGFGNRITV